MWYLGNRNPEPHLPGSVTTFGTMIWSPLAWSRPAWDIIFIVDFSFTHPADSELLSWTYEDPAHIRWRALLMWLVFTRRRS